MKSPLTGSIASGALRYDPWYTFQSTRSSPWEYIFRLERLMKVHLWVKALQVNQDKDDDDKDDKDKDDKDHDKDKDDDKDDKDDKDDPSPS